MNKVTQVLFRKFKDGKIVAVFPYEIYNWSGTVWCYHPVGQHAQCDYNSIIASTSPATEGEYSELKKELERDHKYSLIVIGRRSYWTYQKALIALRGENSVL